MAAKEKEAPAPAAAEASEEKPPTKGKLKLVLIILLVVLPVGGAGTTYFVMAKKPEKVAHRKPATMGPVMPLEAFIVNLNEDGGNRYLKVTLEVELGEATEEEMKRVMPRLRDPLLTHLSVLKVGDALKPGTKDAIKKKVLDIAASVMGKGAIKAVYFKEFVMQ
jgi:flagellar protein FliL